MCCTRLAEIQLQDAKIDKKSPSGHHRTTLSGCIFTTKACIDNRRKKLLNSNISSTRPHSRPIANFGPLTTAIGLLVSGTPAKFNVFRVLASLLHDVAHRRPNFARSLAVSRAGTGRYTIYIHFRELLCPLTEFCP